MKKRIIRSDDLFPASLPTDWPGLGFAITLDVSWGRVRRVMVASYDREDISIVSQTCGCEVLAHDDLAPVIEQLMIESAVRGANPTFWGPESEIAWIPRERLID